MSAEAGCGGQRTPIAGVVCTGSFDVNFTVRVCTETSKCDEIDLNWSRIARVDTNVAMSSAAPVG